MSHKLVWSSPDPWPPYTEHYLCSCGGQVEGYISALVCGASGEDLQLVPRRLPFRDVSYRGSVVAWRLAAERPASR